MDVLIKNLISDKEFLIVGCWFQWKWRNVVAQHLLGKSLPDFLTSCQIVFFLFGGFDQNCQQLIFFSFDWLKPSQHLLEPCYFEQLWAQLLFSIFWKENISSQKQSWNKLCLSATWRRNHRKRFFNKSRVGTNCAFWQLKGETIEKDFFNKSRVGTNCAFWHLKGETNFKWSDQFVLAPFEFEKEKVLFVARNFELTLFMKTTLQFLTKIIPEDVR